ncbi:ABC transporter substrate-binding protein [Lichenibacterium ramalinae]|uniref:ABC transporter substrate-binding protein n=1 Tax=Lichenibacterium ramalinae TaxID=2316527 RepID=A0A4Q2R9I9_9HYPH|nr:ABC transporter substrate-binding protein [Lichenibacterium ramalinae]RYB02575.1 ABC transporter substrate-binding protein [Lichenibacterium ramalinae]
MSTSTRAPVPAARSHAARSFAVRSLAVRSLAVLAMAGLSAVPASAAEKFSYLTNWFAQAEHGGYYQAKAEGLYDKAGIDAEIRMGGPQVNAMQLLLAGEVDAIMGYDFQVLNAVEKGLPAITVATTFQHDLQGAMTHADVPGLAGLKGKTILIASSSHTTFWPWLKAKYGLTDDQTKAYTFNLQPFFADPDTAQQAYSSSEPFQAQEKGVPVHFYLFAKDGYPPYGSTIVTTRKVMETRPEVLKAFIRASMQGWRDYMKDPAPGNALIKAANPKMSEAQIAYGIAKMRELGVLDGDGTVPIGSMTEARWKATDDYMVANGLLKPDTDWHRAFTTAFTADLDAKLN